MDAELAKMARHMYAALWRGVIPFCVFFSLMALCPRGATAQSAQTAPHPEIRGLSEIPFIKECLHCEEPKLPSSVAQRWAGQSATGAYVICIGLDGRVKSVETEVSIDGADDAIKASLRAWQFKPRKQPACFSKILVLGGPSVVVPGKNPTGAPRVTASKQVESWAALPPVQIEIIRGQLSVRIYFHTVTGKGGIAAPAWTFVSRGLGAHGQRELLLTLMRREGEGPSDVPGSVFEYLTLVFQLASKGKLAVEETYTTFRTGFLGFHAVLYMKADNLPAADIPSDVLRVLALTEEEYQAANLLGENRALSNLGRQSLFYPYPYWIERGRSSSVKPLAEAEAWARVPRLRLKGATASKEGNRITLRLSTAARQKLIKILDDTKDKLLPAIVPDWDEEADSCLVEGPRGTEMIGPSGSPAARVAGLMLVLLPSTENKGGIAADGFRVDFAPDSWRAFTQALRAGGSWLRPAMGDSPAFQIVPVRDATGGVDPAERWRPTKRADELTKPAAPDPVVKGPVHLSNIVMLTPLGVLGERIRVDQMMSILSDVTQALESRVSRQSPRPKVDLYVRAEIIPGSGYRFRLIAPPDMDPAVLSELAGPLKALRAPQLGGPVEVLLGYVLWAEPGSRADVEMVAISAECDRRVQARQHQQALASCEREVALYSGMLGPHWFVGNLVGRVANAHLALGQLEEAEKDLLQMLKIRELYQKEMPRDLIAVANELADVYARQGRLALAEKRLKDSLALQESWGTRDSLMVVRTLERLAELYTRQGRYAEAEPLWRRCLADTEKELGTESGWVAETLTSQAEMDLRRGQVAQALPRLQRAWQIRELILRETVSEVSALYQLVEDRHAESRLYGYLLGPQRSTELVELALSVSLLRKGRGAETGSHTNRAILSSLTDPQQREKFEEWQQLRTRLDQLAHARTPATNETFERGRLAQIRQRIEQLEQELAASSSYLRSSRQPSLREVVSRVAARLPSKSVLIEVVSGVPLDGGTSSNKESVTEHYIALILFPDKRIEVVDLGTEETIHPLVETFLARLRNPSSEPRQSASNLYQQIFRPLEPHLRGSPNLLLCLEGLLQAVPYAALFDGKQHLLDRHRIQYLTSGRDLLREPAAVPTEPPVLIADPDFAAVVTPPVPARQNPAAAQQDSLLFGSLERLPGTRREVHAIAAMMPDARSLLGAAATEEALRRLRAPRIMHIATHGMFLSERSSVPEQAAAGAPPSRTSRRLEALAGTSSSQSPSVPQDPDSWNPLTRSVLALAGAARWTEQAHSAQDGMLSAEEVRSLDLWGTKLVVLSACDTGTGPVLKGEGVYGLRRAFFVAGAETLISSLWQVADSETGELMKEFYERLIKGRLPRVTAMQEAMKEMRKRRPHPYYWAPFVVMGQDGPL